MELLSCHPSPPKAAQGAVFCRPAEEIALELVGCLLVKC